MKTTAIATANIDYELEQSRRRKIVEAILDFSLGKDLLRQTPQQAESREHLQELLKVASGGVIFTTAQKFAPEKGEKNYPLLSDRRNIVVIAEALSVTTDWLLGIQSVAA